MTRPPRIVHVTRTLSPDSGGVAEGIRQMLSAASGLRQPQEVAALDAPGAPWLDSADSAVHALGPGRGRFGHAPGLLPWLLQQAGSCDAFVVHGLWQYQGLATWRVHHATGVPYFVFPHGMLDPWFRRSYPGKYVRQWLYWQAVERHVLRDASGVLFTTAEESRLAAQTFAPYRVKPLVVGFGIAAPDRGGSGAPATARAEPFLQAWPLLRGKRLLLFIGRLHPKKGCDLLISALAAATQTDPSLHLVLAGPDPVGWGQVLREQCRQLGVSDQVTFTGMLQGAVKWSALQAADVLVLPSHQENFGVVVAEALSVGLPVLLTRQVNVWSTVVEAGAGLADDDTPEGISRLLRAWLALDASAITGMRAKALPCFAERFVIDHTVRRLVDAVSATGSGHRQGHSRP